MSYSPKTLRILVVHNQYQISGGEDSVVDAEVQLLRGHGHDAELAQVSNRSIASLKDRLRVATRVHFSRWGQQWMWDRLEAFKPDLVHVHNFFPLLSPSIYEVMRERKIPVVQSLHNFRTICANGLLFRDGAPCEDCIGHSPIRAIYHSCYRGSVIGSAAVARMIHFNHKHQTWDRQVDAFIALSHFSKRKLVEGGLPESKIHIKPNFSSSHLPDQSKHREETHSLRVLYAGRLSEEKGIGVLLEAWESLPKVRLILCGDGPLMPWVKNFVTERKLGHVDVRGRIPRPELEAQMQDADLLVLPSLCYENFPMAIAEGFAQGLPALVADHGALAEWVRHGENGVRFRVGDKESLREQIQLLDQDRALLRQLSHQARLDGQRYFSPEANYQRLMAIYRIAQTQKESA